MPRLASYICALMLPLSIMVCACGPVVRMGSEGDDARYAYGFIDKDGVFVIPARYDYADDFSEGLASFTYGDGYGFMDPSGQTVIAPQFEETGSFHEGLAAVSMEGQIGYINTDGQLVISPRFDWGGIFGDGLAAVGLKGLYGYIDKDGAEVIPMRFKEAGRFEQGVALVRDTATSQERWITQTGEPSPPRPSASSGASHAVLTRTPQDRLYGYRDAKGDFAIKPIYQQARSFSEGLAAVKRDGVYGYIGEDGQTRIPFQFNQAHSFREGLARVRIRLP